MSLTGFAGGSNACGRPHGAGYLVSVRRVMPEAVQTGPRKLTFPGPCEFEPRELAKRCHDVGSQSAEDSKVNY
jgi:hypothetical protein